MSDPTYYQLQKQIEKLQGDLAHIKQERDTYGESVKMLSEDDKRLREYIVELEKQNETARQQVTTLREALKKCYELFSDIRGDWTDPRAECREGWKVIDNALAATEKKP